MFLLCVGRSVRASKFEALHAVSVKANFRQEMLQKLAVSVIAEFMVIVAGFLGPL
jgi:hypothetical protein